LGNLSRGVFAIAWNARIATFCISCPLALSQRVLPMPTIRGSSREHALYCSCRRGSAANHFSSSFAVDGQHPREAAARTPVRLPRRISHTPHVVISPRFTRQLEWSEVGARVEGTRRDVRGVCEAAGRSNPKGVERVSRSCLFRGMRSH
jgi:hypothetical protein